MTIDEAEELIENFARECHAATIWGKYEEYYETKAALLKALTEAKTSKEVG